MGVVSDVEGTRTVQFVVVTMQQQIGDLLLTRSAKIGNLEGIGKPIAWSSYRPRRGSVLKQIMKEFGDAMVSVMDTDTAVWRGPAAALHELHNGRILGISWSSLKSTM